MDQSDTPPRTGQGSSSQRPASFWLTEEDEEINRLQKQLLLRTLREQMDNPPPKPVAEWKPVALATVAMGIGLVVGILVGSMI